MTEHDGQAASRSASRGLPAWAYFIIATVLTFVLLIATGFAMAHEHEGGGHAIYALPAGIGALAALTALLGYRRLPRRGGPWARPMALLLLGCIGLALISAITGAIDRTPGEDDVGFAPWVLAGIMVLALWVTIAVWRNLDEAAREAHKWAWYWGSSLAAMVAAPLFLLDEQSQELRQALNIQDTFDNGAMTLLLFQVVGYGLAWLIWWARRR